jgi:hypothetical protein
MTKEELIELIEQSEVPVEKLYKVFKITEEWHLELMEERKNAPTPDKE